MTRATETADIIAESLPNDIPREKCDLLREGSPIPPEPPGGIWRPEYSVSFWCSNIMVVYFRRDEGREVRKNNDAYVRLMT